MIFTTVILGTIIGVLLGVLFGLVPSEFVKDWWILSTESAQTPSVETANEKDQNMAAKEIVEE